MLKPIPKFKNEDEEREFWATHDSTEYIDWKNAKKVTAKELEAAARSLYHDYKKNKELTAFTAIDGDDFMLEE